MDVKQLGIILTVWAHPDDESFCAAGTIAAAIKNGQKVVCVTATKGEAGVQDTKRWPQEKLAEIREAELQKTLKTLGVKNHHFLGYKDGECEYGANEAVEKIKSLIAQYKPDTIITFGPDGMTGHPDHRAVSKWVTLAVAELKDKPLVIHPVQTRESFDKYFKQMDDELNIFFNIKEPHVVKDSQCDFVYKLSPELCDIKYQALLAQESQMTKMMQSFDEDFLKSAFSTEAFVKAK